MTILFRRVIVWGGAIAISLLAAGCAGVMPKGTERAEILQASATEQADPLEKGNRSALRANKFFNDVAVSPVAHGYQKVVPEPVRRRVSNVASNLSEPRIFANDVLQFRFKAAGNTLGRFVFNTTIGLVGLFDVATKMGLPKQTGDFGQTLFVWGFDSGPYLVIPVFGPSTIRDGIGLAVDTITDPASQALSPVIGVWPVIGVRAADGLENVELLDDLEAGSLDDYVRLRSVYLQQRASELGDAVGVKIEPEVVTESDNK
jgi:phospholipid-binding lipoprotein MlaA